MKTTHDDWLSLRKAFEGALPLDPDKREAYLEQEFPENDELRARVHKMLSVEDDPGGFLEPPTFGRAEAAPLIRREGRTIGSFKILRLLAAGGMGAVYEAEQEDPARRVALKILRSDLAGDHARRRFRDEIDFLARLRHPNIAQIYEAGTFDDSEGSESGETPWFAMELVENGRSIVRYAREEKIDLWQVLSLFQGFCSAVHYGHQKGVIHRDLKPANLLVDSNGGVKVIDFGVARATDENAYSKSTQAGDVVGTLLYMSPEQIESGDSDLDVRADVYALGVVLYELLAQRAPFDLSRLSITAASRHVLDSDPLRLTTLVDVPLEIEWITHKALSKDRDARYGSALELSEDLDRFLNHHPVVAGPTSKTYTLRKFVRRHRVGVAATLLVLSALTAAVVGTTIGLVRAKRAEVQATVDRAKALEAERKAKEEHDAATKEAEKANQVVEFLVDLFSSPDPGRDGREVLVVDALQSARGKYESQFANRPEVSARMASAIGVVYHGLGLDEDAIGELRSSLRIANSESPDPSEDKARVLRELGNVYLDRGDLSSAEEVLLDALSMHESLKSADSAGAYRTRAHLGRLRLHESRFDEAMAYLEPTLEWMRTHLGEDHRDTLFTTSTLASLVHKQGLYEEAKELYQEAITGIIALTSSDHPEVISMRSNLALLYHGQGKTDKAIGELREVLATRKRTLGEDHPDTLGTFANLGGLLQLQGELDEAAQMYDAGLSKMEELLPGTHPALQALRGNLATLERDLGHYERAEELLTLIHDSRTETLGPGHPRTIGNFYELVRVARLAGNFELAHERAQAGLEALRNENAQENSVHYAYAQEVGLALLGLERFDEAERALQTCAAVFERTEPTEDWVEPPDQHFVQLYEAWGKKDLAELHRTRLKEATE